MAGPAAPIEWLASEGAPGVRGRGRGPFVYSIKFTDGRIWELGIWGERSQAEARLGG